jgi:hypothetical protein
MSPLSEPGSIRPGQIDNSRTCEMPLRECGAVAVLLTGGPVRVPFRTCCMAALIQDLGERPA